MQGEGHRGWSLVVSMVLHREVSSASTAGAPGMWSAQQGPRAVRWLLANGTSRVGCLEVRISEEGITAAFLPG